MARDPVAVVVQRLSDEGRLGVESGFDIQLAPYGTEVQVSGSSSVVVAVLAAPGGWALPGVHTARFPLVVVNVYADKSRDGFGMPVADDAAERAWAVWALIDPSVHLHSMQSWPDVVSSRRHTEPDVLPVPDGDGAVLLSARYELALI